jgi:hypothetical protein
MQNRLRRIVQKANDRIIGIRVDPRNHNPAEKYPYVGPKYVVQDLGERNQEVCEQEHTFLRISRAKESRADANDRRSLFNGDGKVVRHTHREVFQIDVGKLLIFEL